MHELTSDTVEEFLAGFDHLYDSTITGVTVSYDAPRAERSVTLRIQATDVRGDAPTWTDLTLVLTGAPEFTIREAWNQTYSVPGDGARVSHFDGRTFVDLDTLEGDEDTVESYRGSNFYVAADHCTWEARPITGAR